MEDGFDNFDVRLISGKEILKPTWFEHVYCGLALGFAKDHRKRDSFVRCLLCRQDVRIASRGITTFWEHCRGVRHHRLDCLVRLRRGLALRKRDGTLMSKSEADECSAALIGEAVPVLEACPNVTVLEALQIESAGGSVWGVLRGSDDVDQTESVRLFVCSIEIAILRVFGISGTSWWRPTVSLRSCLERLVESPTFWLL